MSEIETDERGVIVSCPKCAQPNRISYERMDQLPRCARCQTRLTLPAEPIELRSEAAFAALTGRSALPVLIDFWAPWCGPCKMVAPEIAKVATVSVGRWIVAKLNTEELPAAAQRFGISAIPLMIAFKAGREVARQAGAMPAAAIRQFMQAHA